MNININFIHLDHSDALKKYIEMKFGFLEKLTSKIDRERVATLFVDVSRSTRHHLKGEIYKASVVYKLPKKTFRVADTDVKIQGAVSKTRDILKGLVQEYKDSLSAS